MELKFSSHDAALVAWGIDLGTTNSTLCQATLDAGAHTSSEPEVVELRQRTPAGEYISTLLPSMVAVKEAQEFIGEGAKNLRALMADPQSGLSRNVNLFYDCKNEIGTSRTYPNAPEGLRSPTEVAAKVLGFIRAEGMAGASSMHTVVTVPASFQAAQRAETARACARAGLDVGGGRLLDEPVAAFIDYAYRYDPQLVEGVSAPRILLVFDFGGGTCDIAVFELSRGDVGAPLKVASRAVSRFHRLGGGDIDLAILHKVLIAQLCAENGLAEFDLSFQDKTRTLTPALIALAESLKVQLCNEIWRLKQFGRLDGTLRRDIVVRYPSQVSVRLRGQDLKLSRATLSAEQFDKVLAPFLDIENLFLRSTEYRMENSIFSPIFDALERASVQPDDVAMVLAVGGSAMIPQVQDALTAYFPKARLLAYEDPKDAQLAVARGASLHALSLAANGRGVVEPVAQDDIFLATAGGDLKLIARGAPLPYPPEGEAVIDTLTVPADAFDEPLPLSVELVAGPERRPLFRDTWMLHMVRRGDPLRLEFSYDGNQVLSLALRLAKIEEAPPFQASIDNPLSHVVNPNEIQEKIDQLEEAHRRNPRQARTNIPKIASLCADLGQHEKAIGLIRALLNQANQPDSNLHNRLGMYEEARGNFDAAVTQYELATQANPRSHAPLFNLALLHERENRYPQALATIDRALAVDADAPTKTLKLRIRKGMGQGAMIAEAKALLPLFEPLSGLDDWTLSWQSAAASMSGDAAAVAAGDKERAARREGRTTKYILDDAVGMRPEMRGEGD